MPRREVVAAVDDDVRARGERGELVGPDPGRDRLHRDERVDRGEPRLGGRDLRLADIRCRVEYLALEVGEVDAVRIADRQRPDTRRDEKLGDRRAEPAGTDHENMRGGEALLRFDAELREQDVPAVAEQLSVVHRRGRVPLSGMPAR